MGKFVVSKVRCGFKFALKASNGEIIATSEKYKEKSGCLNGVESVRNNCTAHIEDQTVAGFEKLTNPKYEIYLDKAKEFRFRLKARNGEIIATGEGYASKAGCQNGIASIQKNAPTAEIVEG